MIWPAIPALLGILLALFVPDSPKFLYLAKDNKAEATRALEYFFADEETDMQGIFDEYDRERKYLMDEPEPTWHAIWADIRLKRGFIVSFMTICSLTTVGIGIILKLRDTFCQDDPIEIVAQYSSTIFEDAGFSDSEAAIATTCTMIPALVIALILMPYIDRVGRRPMLITAMIGAAFAHIILLGGLQISIVAITAVVLITVCHFAGVGPVGRFIVAEMCPQACRSKVAGAGWIGKWALATIYTIAFPVLLNKIGQLTFIISATFCILFIVWFWRFLPETKQRPVDNIVDRFGLKRKERVGKHLLAHNEDPENDEERLLDERFDLSPPKPDEATPLIADGGGKMNYT